MKKFEKNLLIVTFIITLLSIFNVLFTSQLAFILFALLSFTYMFFSFAIFNNIKFKGIFKSESYNEVGKLRLVATVLLGLVIGPVLLGYLFFFLALKNMKNNWEVNIYTLIIISIFCFYKYNKTKSTFHLKILKRTFLFSIIGIFYLFVPKYFMIDFKYRNHPTYLKALKQSMDNSNDEKNETNFK